MRDGLPKAGEFAEVLFFEKRDIDAPARELWRQAVFVNDDCGVRIINTNQLMVLDPRRENQQWRRVN